MKLLICAQVVDKNHPILGFFHGWILEFSKHFSEVYVICLQKGEYELPGHVHVLSLGKEEGVGRLTYLYRFYGHFSRVFFKVRVGFVFFHMGAIYNILAAPFFFLRKSVRTRFVWWKAHGYINRVGRIALLFCDRIVTSTESGFPVETKKRRIVGQAIDTDLFTLPRAGSRSKEIIFVGRIMPIKHPEDFIEVARMLGTDAYHFSIIGPLEDDPYTEKIRQQAAEAGVHLCGSQTQHELVSTYQTAEFFLNTSLTHSLDKTVLEGILCGCIPITANLAFKELLEPEGLYVATPTVDAYAVAIANLATKDRDAVRKRLYSEVVRKHSLQTFPERIFGLTQLYD